MSHEAAELEGFAAVMEGARNASERLKGRAIAGPYDYDQFPALVERSKLRVKNLYADFDARLAALPPIAGDHFSAGHIFGGDGRFNELSGARRARSAETRG